MWLNLQFPTDLVAFTEQILNRKLLFWCSVSKKASMKIFTKYYQKNIPKYINFLGNRIRNFLWFILDWSPTLTFHNHIKFNLWNPKFIKLFASFFEIILSLLFNALTVQRFVKISKIAIFLRNVCWDLSNTFRYNQLRV